MTVSAIKLRNGKTLLSAEAPGGIYNPAQLKLIAALSEVGVSIVKATEDQRLALMVDADKVPTVTDRLKSAGLGVRGYQAGLHQPTACIGEACAESEQDALGDALAVSQAIQAIAVHSPLKIGINGCAKCCVPCHTLDIAIVGESSGYRLSMGGKNSQIPELASFMAEGIPADEIAGIVARLITTYADVAQEGESLQEVIERCGAQPFADVMAPYSQDAVGSASMVDLGEVAMADASQMIQPANLESMGHGAALKIEESAMDSIDEESTMSGDDLPVKKDDGSMVDDVDIDPRQFAEGDSLADDLRIDAADVATDGAPQDISPAWGDDLASMEPELMPAPAQLAAVESELPLADLKEEVIGDDELAVSVEEMQLDGGAIDEESALESKLNLAIAEEEQIGVVEDDTAEERDATMRLVEEVSEHSVDEESLSEDQAVSGALLEAEFGAKLSSVEDEFADLQDSDDRATATLDHLAWTLAGVDIVDAGKLSITFSSGASMQLDSEQIMRDHKPRQFNFGGTAITITPARNGIKVAADGLELFVPMSLAA